jgi:hypothetical protein
MIDTRAEKLIPLSRATKLKNLPRRRGLKRPHAATFYRWARYGVRGVQLETIRVGGTLCTTAEALQRFFEKLSGAGLSDPVRKSELDDRAKAVSRKLDAAGF